MRVLMLNPPFHPRFSRSQRSPAKTRSGNLYYPIWLGYATGALEQAGHEVVLLDAPARGLDVPTVLQTARAFDPQMIVTDTSTPSIDNDLQVAQALRLAIPNAFQVLVGTHASALPEPTLSVAPFVDAIARREYDATLVDLALVVKERGDLNTVLGLTYRRNEHIEHTPNRRELGGSELDRLPFVSQVWKRHLRVSDYRYSITPHPQVTIITGRGCPYKCNFCVWPQVMTGHQYRRRSVENVVDEFDWIGKNLPGVHVFLEDDTFTVNRKRCHALAEALIRNGNKVRFTANARADVDFDTLSILKHAGLRMVCTGFESASNEILSNVEKRLEVSQARDFARDARKAGVLVHGCFMAGNQGETKGSLDELLDFACELDPDSAQFFPLMVYPGTTAYDQAVADGSLVSTSWPRWLTTDGSHNATVSRGAVGSSEIDSWCNHARRKFYVRPRYMLKKLVQGMRDRDEMVRNIQAARELTKHLISER